MPGPGAQNFSPRAFECGPRAQNFPLLVVCPSLLFPICFQWRCTAPAWPPALYRGAGVSSGPALAVSNGCPLVFDKGEWLFVQWLSSGSVQSGCPVDVQWLRGLHVGSTQ